ncbi:hypothetical protein [Acinetobacter radioresistens]|uniref:hypothetical protein n=1 Tax=Acinetobacter radioresistens TaxID=40216 RepID=UPI0032132841
MIKDHQTEELFKEVLANLFRLVVIYSCEMIKTKKRFPDMYRWFEENNEVIAFEIRNFLREKKGSNFSIKVDSFDDMIQFDLFEDDIVYELNQYFWDLKQFHDISYNKALISELKIDQDLIEKFFYNLIDNLTSPKEYTSEYLDFYNFFNNYALSSFLSKDRANQSIFRYFQLYAEIVSPNVQLENKAIQRKFIDLLREIPYYSIFARTSTTGLSTFNTSQGKKYYSTLKTPLNFKQGTLVDNLLHFLFQHLIELFYFDFLKDDPKNFKLKLAVGKSNFLNGQRSPKYNKLYECNNIMKLLLQTWPKEQHLVYRSVEKEGSIIPVLRSIMYENFLDEYDKSIFSHNDSREKTSPNKIKRDKDARARILAFFKYLECGFLDMGFKVKMSVDADKTDNWKIEFISNSRNSMGNFTWTWNQIKSAYSDHKKKTNLFNYE